MVYTVILKCEANVIEVVELNRHFVSANYLSAYHALGIEEDQDYLVSDEEMPGAKKLANMPASWYDQMQPSGTWQGENGDTLYFCITSVYNLFGKIPQVIYYKKIN
jgi:hypothetical protein